MQIGAGIYDPLLDASPSQAAQYVGQAPAIEIATELGTTSNAVIGRIHRLSGTYQEKIKTAHSSQRDSATKAKSSGCAAAHHSCADARAHKFRFITQQGYCPSASSGRLATGDWDRGRPIKGACAADCCRHRIKLKGPAQIQTPSLIAAGNTMPDRPRDRR